MKVSLVVFAINEIDGLRAMMPKIKKDWYDELIIVDGGSTDGSIEYARENGYDLFVQKEKGPGAAINEAVKKTTGDFVILYAPDGSFEVERIPEITEKLKSGYDIVNVSRYYNGTKSFDDNIFTYIGNKTFTWLANCFTPFRFTDFLYTYVGFNKKLVSALDVDTSMITWAQILMLRAIRNKYKIVEIPGTEYKRIGGQVKVPKIRTSWFILYTILRETLF